MLKKAQIVLLILITINVVVFLTLAPTEFNKVGTLELDAKVVEESLRISYGLLIALITALFATSYKEHIEIKKAKIRKASVKK